MRDNKHGLTPTPTLVSLQGFFRRATSNRNAVKTRPMLVSGFTLVEMVIYLGFFAVLSILSIQGTIIAMKSFYSLRLTQSVNQSASVALERLSREILVAYDIDELQSTFGVSPGRLMLNTKTDAGALTTREFYVTGNQLSVKEGGVDRGSLMTKNVILSNLVFRQSTTTESLSVKIEMTLRDNRAVPPKDIKFYNTIVLRGSIH